MAPRECFSNQASLDLPFLFAKRNNTNVGVLADATAKGTRKILLRKAKTATGTRDAMEGKTPLCGVTLLAYDFLPHPRPGVLADAAAKGTRKILSTKQIPQQERETSRATKRRFAALPYIAALP